MILVKVKRMYKTKGGFQLTLQTLSLVVGFMAWSIIAPLMPFIKQDVNVTEGQISIILAIPVILGSVLRVPFGYLTNIVGAKWVFFTSFIVLLFPIFFLSQAQTPGMLMASGFFLGVGGAIFSVGVTSVPKYFPKESRSSKWYLWYGEYRYSSFFILAPPIAGIIGWQTTVRSYLIIIALFALIMFILVTHKNVKLKCH